jgi:hypothetical protein
MELTAALRILQAATDGVPIAPHVAGRLAAFVRGHAHALAALGAKLSPAQLRGAMMLPDPLPVPPTLRSLPLESLLTAERRLLLFAALDSICPCRAHRCRRSRTRGAALRTTARNTAGRQRPGPIFGRASARRSCRIGRKRGGSRACGTGQSASTTGHAAAAAAHLVAAHPRRLPTLSTALIARAETAHPWPSREAHALAHVITEAGGDIAARVEHRRQKRPLGRRHADARAAFAGVGHSSAWGRRRAISLDSWI